MLFRPLSVSIWAIAKAIHSPSPTPLGPRAQQREGSSLEVSGGEMSTHPTHTAQVGVAPEMPTLAFCHILPALGNFQPMANPTARLPGLWQVDSFVKPQA